MYTLNLPQTLTTVLVLENEKGAWFTALFLKLREDGYSWNIEVNYGNTENTVVVVDSLMKTATHKYPGSDTVLSLLPSISQVLKVNNNAVMYDRLSTLADGSLGNSTVSSHHLMD